MHQDSQVQVIDHQARRIERGAVGSIELGGKGLLERAVGIFGDAAANDMGVKPKCAHWQAAQHVMQGFDPVLEFVLRIRIRRSPRDFDDRHVLMVVAGNDLVRDMMGVGQVARDAPLVYRQGGCSSHGDILYLMRDRHGRRR